MSEPIAEPIGGYVVYSLETLSVRNRFIETDRGNS